MTVRLFEPSKRAKVIPLGRSKFPPDTRARFQAFARGEVKARRWAGVEQGWTEEGLEYWVVCLPGGDVPGFDLSRDKDGSYVVAKGGAVLARLDEDGLFRWLDAAC